MKSFEVRKRFLDFFAKRGHAILPSASLVPKNDPSVLFNTAGMQPLVPYLMGEKHPLGDRLASCQKCVRTVDIEEVGNHKNLSFFEMLGNWSLGSYFKEDAIAWSYEFLTSKEEGLGLDPKRLYVTVFEGDEDAPKDMEAVEIWKKFIPENRIYFLPKKNNWWSPGDNGPCGPDTEMFYDVTEKGLGDMTHDEYVIADEKGEVVEIWNDVFMEYEKRDGKVIGKLSQKNVDTGSGLERISMIVQGKTNVYESDVFSPAMEFIELNTKGIPDERSYRIIADHVRSATMLIGDGVFPSNKDQGYVLRRFIRRAVVQAKNIGFSYELLGVLQHGFITKYEDIYPELKENINEQKEVFSKEVEKFIKTLEQGLKEFEKGTEPFILATTYGFPIEITEEIAREKGMSIDRADFDTKMKAHQDASRAGAEQKFKGGLANTSEQTTRLHTAHHLLLKALQEVVSPDIHQKGSNITEERLRIDFNFDRKLSDQEKKAVEEKVNEWINQDLKVVKRDMPKTEAEKLGAEMEFGVKYPEIVSVYFIEDANGNAISKEFCGGPHVSSIGTLGTFKIQKEEASSAGIRRIKAVLL
jgi:alanyl-tRNA synthetase